MREDFEKHKLPKFDLVDFLTVRQFKVLKTTTVKEFRVRIPFDSYFPFSLEMTSFSCFSSALAVGG
jgi:hypothetical protein